MNSRRPGKPSGVLSSSSGLGPLEARLLEYLWLRPPGATVRDLTLACPELAYTTIMTTLERLHRKRLLSRYREGRAFVYQPRCTRDELISEVMSGHVSQLLEASRQSSLILSTLVRAVRETDVRLLDELEALVQAERLRLKDRQG